MAIPDNDAPSATRPGFVEFVVLVALLMGITALSIDNLLPALPLIGTAFAVADPNELQYLIYLYMVGFGVGQMVYGPVSDAIGRRPAMFAGLAIYGVGCALAVASTRFDVLIAARIVMGLGAAAARVLAIAIVRDRFAGREMARVMSLTMMVFLIVPTVAPAVGSATLLLGSWRILFAGMLVLAAVVGLWFVLRMPETLHPSYRRRLEAKSLWEGVRVSATTRIAFGYATALGLLFGSLLGYVGSAEQVFDSGLYHLGPLFPLAFAVVAMSMAAATLANAGLVRRFGMRRLSHGGLVGFVLVSLGQVGCALAYDGHPPLPLFLLGVSAAQFFVAFALPNFNALAMEPLARVAGTASSLMGFYTTLMGAAAGVVVGQSFDGTVVPMCVGYATLGLAAFAVVAWTERGRLFQPHQPDAVAPTMTVDDVRAAPSR